MKLEFVSEEQRSKQDALEETKGDESIASPSNIEEEPQSQEEHYLDEEEDETENADTEQIDTEHADEDDS